MATLQRHSNGCQHQHTEEDNIDDLRVTELRPLIPPSILIEELPVTPAIATTVRSARAQAARIVRRRPGDEDDRLLVIVGPCSIHDPTAALEYGTHIPYLLVWETQTCFRNSFD